MKNLATTLLSLFLLIFSLELSAQERSPSSQNKVDVTFENLTLAPIDYYWVNYQGDKALTNTLEPGKKINWTTYEGHIWKFEQNGHPVAKYVAIGQKNQVFQIRRGSSAPTSQAVNVSFKNDAAVPVDLNWVDFNGKEIKYAELEPGQTLVQPTYVAHLWNFQFDGVVIGSYLASSSPSQSYSISASYISSRKRGWGWLGYIPIVNTFYIAALAADSKPVTAEAVESHPSYQTTVLKAKYVGEDKPGSMMYGGRIVKYLKPEELKQYRLHVQSGKLIKADMSVFDSSVAKEDDPVKRGKAIYVMDKEGRIYASNYPVIGEFHHSSFLAGEPVAAAGEIEVKNGKILYINNESGHYKPEKYLIDQFVDELQRQGYPEAELSQIYSRYRDELKR
ncbi:MAG: hypothetical protein RLN90_10380 [Balneolaceae bacterium]